MPHCAAFWTSPSHAGNDERVIRLPGFHRHDLDGRRKQLAHAAPFTADEWDALSVTPALLEISDVMVESAAGCVAVPLGIAEGFLIDGEEVAVPLAVEEASVIAAASFAARLLRGSGGFHTWASEPVMSAQVFLEGVTTDGESRLQVCGPRVRDVLAPLLASLASRGGGFREVRVTRLPGTGAVRVDVLIDVRDAMGANRLNSAAEFLRPLVEQVSGGRVLMAILSNEARDRLAGARVEIPVDDLGIGLPSGMDGKEAARRIAAASAIAGEDPSRAVTHNKGIMNGITSLALATMNDARAVEAAAHAWASRTGRYTALSTWSVDSGLLKGSLELPLALATVGGAVDFHPAARASLRILGQPGAPRLSRIAAAVGLAQNFAALRALVTHGIQKGHMHAHAARLAWRAGARGPEVRRLADAISRAGTSDEPAARALLARMRDGPNGR
jgi:hydroxymethylglutaryl-CoA reductase